MDETEEMGGGGVDSLSVGSPISLVVVVVARLR